MLVLQKINTAIDQIRSSLNNHEPLRFDLMLKDDLEDLYRGWAPSLAETLGLADFALGKEYKMLHDAHPLEFNPATVAFEYVYLSDDAECNYEIQPNIRSLVGSSAIMPSGHVVKVTHALFHIRDVLAKRWRAGYRTNVSLVGVANFEIRCQIYKPQPDHSIAMAFDHAGAAVPG